MSSQLVFEALWRDRGAAAGLKGLGAAADQSASKYGKLSTAAKVGMLAAGAAVLKFGVSSVKAYSEAETSQAKLGFTLAKFPRLADTSQASLQKLNAALQLKTKYDDDAIASGQAVLGQFNMTGKQLEQLTPLLLDFASKTGRDLPTAAKTMGQAFLGNTRALKEIGISYKTTGDQATDFANITALMRKQVGGFAATEGKTAAGQLAILQNQFGELQEAAGAKLVPALTQVTTGLIKGVQVVGQYSNVIGPTVVGIGALATIIWAANKAQQAWAITQALSSGLAVKAVGGLNALKVAFTGVELTAAGASRAMRVAQLSIPVVGIALFAASTAAAAWVSKGTSATAAANEFSTSMQSVQGNITRATAALNENVRATAVNALQSKGAFDQARLLGIGLDELTDAALGNEYAIKAVNAQIKSGYGGTSAQVKASGELARTFRLTSDAAGAATKAEQDRRVAMGAGATASEAAAAAAAADAAKQKEHAAALQVAADKARALANALLGLSGSQIGMEAAIDAATASAKENGKTLDVNTAKGRANKQALDSLASATLSYTDGLIKAKAPAEDIVAANERGRSSFIKTARAMGVQKGEAISMADALFKIPKSVQSKVIVAGGKISVKQAKDLNAAIRKLPKEQRSKIVTIANTKGATAAWKEIAKVKNKSVITKATGKGVNTVKEIDAAIKKLKSKAVRAQANTAGKGAVNALDNAIRDLKSRKVHASATTSGKGAVDSLTNAINRVHGKTVWVTVKKRGGGVTIDANGGTMGRQYLADGGTIRGMGGPRQDNIATVDRESGVQLAWTSVGEELINARQSALNRRQLKQINAGGKWDLIPRRADGGTMGRTRDLVGARVGGGAASVTQVINIHAPNYIGPESQLLRGITTLDNRGALDRLARGWQKR